MKSLRKIVCSALAILLLVGVCGCMDHKEISATDRMIEYLNTRYDDKFHYSHPYSGGAGASSRKIVCTSEKFPGQDVCVILYEDKNGQEKIVDNYMGVKYYDQTVAALEESLRTAFGVEFKLFYETSMIHATEGASNEMTFEEYAAEVSSGISFTAVIDGSYNVEQDTVVSDLEQAIRDNGICCSLAIVYFNGSDLSLDQIDREMLTGYFNKKQYAHRLDFTMDTVDAFSSVKWR